MNFEIKLDENDSKLKNFLTSLKSKVDSLDQCNHTNDNDTCILSFDNPIFISCVYLQNDHFFNFAQYLFKTSISPKFFSLSVIYSLISFFFKLSIKTGFFFSCIREIEIFKFDK